jgi:hypothetical protein
MTKMWDPVNKKWVDKPAGAQTAGLIDPRSRTAKITAPVTIPQWNEQIAGEAAAEEMLSNNTGDPFAATFGGGGGGGGGGQPTRQQSRQWGLAAARGLRQTGQRAGQALRQRAGEQVANMQGFYNPVFEQQRMALGQQQSNIDAQRQAALNFLQQQYGTNQQAIQQATQNALANLPQAQAYSNVPIVQLSPQENQLMSALSTFGAGTGAVDTQSAQDAALAAQTAQLARNAAAQLNAAQQNMRVAASSDLDTQQAAALRQLALQRMGQEGAITSGYQQALADLEAQRGAFASEQAGVNAEIEAMRQDLLNRALETELGAESDAAKLRAEVIAQYGRPPKKARAGGKTKGRGKK